MSESDFHVTTFKKFLKLIDVDYEKTTQYAFLCPAIRAFNCCLTTACTFDEVEVGIGCLGVIEQAFSTISGIIGRAVVARKWIKEEDLIHYKLHEQIDERHAEEFFAVLEPRWHKETPRYFSQQGIELGAHIFNTLYQSLATPNWPETPRSFKAYEGWDI